MNADLSTVKGSYDFIQKLKEEKVVFDSIVVCIAVFPDWNDLLTSEGLDKSFAVVVLGRYILYKECGQFLTKDDPRIMNVLVGGNKPMGDLDRDIITGKKNVSNLIQALGQMVITNDLMMLKIEKLLDSNVHITITHPGFLITDLHRGQGVIADIFEKVIYTLKGVTEYDSGRGLVSILASPKLLVKKLTYFDDELNGRGQSKELLDLAKTNYDWLIKFLDDHIAKHKK